MAENNKKNENQPSGSLLKTAVTVVPISASIYKALNSVDTQTNVAKKTRPLEDAIKQLNKVKRPSMSQHLDFINQLSKKSVNAHPTYIKSLKQAWKLSLLQTNSTQRGITSTFSSLGDLPDEAFIAGLQNLQSNTSQLSDEVFSTFRKNVSVLSKQDLPGIYQVKDLMLTHKSMIPDYKTASFSRIETTLNKSFQNNWYASYVGDLQDASNNLGIYDITLDLPKFGPIDIKVPLSSKGVILEGTTLSSKRISPDIGIVTDQGIQKLSREEYFLKEISESIIPKLQSGHYAHKYEAQDAIQQLYSELYSELETVPNIPTSITPLANRQYELLKGKQIDLRVPTTSEKSLTRFVEPTVEQTSNIIKKYQNEMPLFAGTGGTGFAQGRLQTTNLAELTLFPEAVDWSRKPEAVIRQFDISDSTKAYLQSLEDYSKLNDYTPAKALLTTQGIQFRTLYVDPTKLGMGEGIAYGKQEFISNLSYDYTTTHHLKILPTEDVDEYLANLSSKKAGDILGWDTSNDVVKMNENMRILSATKNFTQGKGDFLTLQIANTRELRNNEKWHGDFKGLVEIVDNHKFNGIQRKLFNNLKYQQNIDLIVDINELKKDPAKFAKQVWSGLTEVSKNIGAPPEGSVLRDFLLNQDKYLENIRAASIAGGGWSNEQFVTETMKLAKEFDLSAAEFGTVFGAVPTVLGKEKAANIFGSIYGNTPEDIERHARYYKFMTENVAFGVARGTYGGPETLRGAGKMGSFEPRAFDILQSSEALADIREDLIPDIIQRMNTAQPDKFAAYEELQKTLRSINKEITPSDKESIFDISQYTSNELIPEFKKMQDKNQAFWIRQGEGLADVYVPSTTAFNRMSKQYLANEKEISGDISKLYQNYVRNLGALYSNIEQLSPQETKKVTQDFFNIIEKEWAPGGKGAGSALRGRVTGSVFGTGVDTLTGFKPQDLRTVGVSSILAEKMFQDIEATGLWDQVKLNEMKARFESGEEVAGLISRHPFIGEHSIQPIKMQRVTSDLPQIAIPEQVVSNIKPIGMDKSVDLRLSPLVGMAGDKDADIFSLMLVSPDQEKTLRQNINNTNNQASTNYLQHQVRNQLIKAKSVGDDASLSTLERMVGGARKLAVAPEWVPKLSLQMSEAKRAVRTFGAGENAQSALGLLEWLEQTPISGKHLSLKQTAAGATERQMIQLSSALSEGRSQGVKEIVQQIISGNQIANEMLTKDISFSAEDVARISDVTGMNMPSTIKGMNIDATLDTIMSAQKQYRESGLSKQVDILSGRSNFTSKKAVSEIINEQIPKKANLGSMLSSKILSAENKVAAMGGKLIQNHKAIGLGFAGSLALGAILSAPKNTIGSMEVNLNNNIKTPTNADTSIDTDALAAQRAKRNMQAPNLTTNNRALVSPMSHNMREDVNLTTDNQQSQNIIGNMRRLRDTKINIRDNRYQLSEHAEANKIG